MRTFIVLGHRATTNPDFSLEDIPGTSGRLDILCRCINAAFVLSHGIRRDVQVFLILGGGEPQKTVWLKGQELRHLNPDERTTAALLKKALAIVAGSEWARSTPGISVRTGGLKELFADLHGSRLFYLREDGADIRQLGSEISEGSFLLGDHLGMLPEEELMAEEAGADLVSVGPVSLHADHCIVLLNWLMDTGAV
jgi:tRNA (pseudouridine54-N1)-methyltransferase